MKVSDLIVALSELDPEAHVVLQADPEGNSYCHMRGVEGGMVFIDNRYEQTVKYRKLTKKLKDDGYDKSDCWNRESDGDAEDCVVIFP